MDASCASTDRGPSLKLDNFANDTQNNRDEAFQEAAARLGLSKSIVEKDFWVCWSLRKLFALPSFGDHLIFKGGTSLSKAYNAIYRFSEDVDLSLDRNQLGFTGTRDPEGSDVTGGQRKDLLKELQQTAEKIVAGPLLGEIQSSFGASLEQDFTLATDPRDAQTLLFTYPSTAHAGVQSGYVQPIIRFEFGARGVTIPAEERVIVPYLHEAFPALLGTAHVTANVLGIERTFWEKATILHMLFHQDATKLLSDRMSRHYYDMAMLIDHDAKIRAMANLPLLDLVAHHKSVFFKAAWARYDTAKVGSLRLLPSPEIEVTLRRDYIGMKEMLIGDAPSFDDILGKIAAFEHEVNADTTTQKDPFKTDT